ncbi:hypothetical protein VUR80DRAFT_9200 [Thermomyces stellatus]
MSSAICERFFSAGHLLSGAVIVWWERRLRLALSSALPPGRAQCRATMGRNGFSIHHEHRKVQRRVVSQGPRRRLAHSARERLRAPSASQYRGSVGHRVAARAAQGLHAAVSTARGLHSWAAADPTATDRVRHPALSADLHQPAVLLVEAHDVQPIPPLPHRAFPFFS